MVLDLASTAERSGLGRPSIGLALGSGGARGCAHIGVIRGLERMALRPAGVAGASMGALVGALYALGMSADHLASLRLGVSLRSAIRPMLSRAGLLDPTRLVELIDRLVGDRTFSDTVIPLKITAADLVANERVVLDEGPVAPAVIASMMIPGVFPPYPSNQRLLADPGFLDPIPLDVAAELGPDTVIAVSGDLAPDSWARRRRTQPPFSWVLKAAGSFCRGAAAWAQWPWAGHLGCTLEAMAHEQAIFAAASPVIWIQPSFGGMSANHFWDCERAIRLGEEAVDRAALQLAPFFQRRASPQS